MSSKGLFNMFLVLGNSHVIEEDRHVSTHNDNVE